MSELVIQVKDLDVTKSSEGGLLNKIPFIKEAKHSLEKLKERYEKVEVQIDRSEGQLEKALKLQQEVMDTTNELLRKNSEMLKTNIIETAKASEKGIVELDTLKKVNDDLIATIEETMKIQKEGREKRQAAEQELVRLEGELKNKLMEIKA